MPRRLFLQSMGPDLWRSGTGTSPDVGDLGYTGLLVPQEPTVSQRSRYAFRLAAVSVAEGERARIQHIKQFLTVGQCITIGSGLGCYVLEQQIIDPLWSFPDGNVSWHLRRVSLIQTHKALADPAPGSALAQRYPGCSHDLYGTDPALLFNILPNSYVPAGVPYEPPANGMLPGDDIAGLGQFHDLRFGCQSGWPSDELKIDVCGPCVVGLYASVWQTDPATRVCPATGAVNNYVTSNGVSQDNALYVSTYFASWSSLRYWRIGAIMVVDIYSPGQCEAMKCGE